LLLHAQRRMMRDMKHLSHSRTIAYFGSLLFLLAATRHLIAEPTPAAIAAFNAYTNAVESRLARQHRSPSGFLAPTSSNLQVDELRLRRGDLILERLTPTSTNLPGALLHHWRGTAFVPGATAADFEHLLRGFDGYPQHFAPQVLQARVLSHDREPMQVSMRIRQRHVITVVLDATYDVTFSQLDAQHGYSLSRSTHISEIDAPGTRTEHALSSTEEHGFLWRLNTYWSYEQRDGGLYVQIEAVSLTRSIPRGLDWAIRPYIESIPHESLEFTLRSASNAIRR
jgi:hypothetical protein